jgi:hypothetical protein
MLSPATVLIKPALLSHRDALFKKGATLASHPSIVVKDPTKAARPQLAIRAEAPAAQAKSGRNYWTPGLLAAGAALQRKISDECRE